MSVNPAKKAKVAESVKPDSWDSGINSSTTTKIIAPAAKDRAYGSSAVICVTAQAPRTAPIGSIIADNFLN